MPAESLSRKQILESIYSSHGWDGQSQSCPYSDQKNTTIYIDFANKWLVRHSDCKDIVEVGCGDWATTRPIHLTSSHSYTGYDIVPEVVACNIKSFQTPSVRFVCANFLEEPPKEADLTIVKDVFKHLFNDR